MESPGLNNIWNNRTASVRNANLYQTPPEATRALLGAVELPACIWEPACGPGSMVRVLRASGRAVYATDLTDYNSPDQDEARWDFLMQRQAPIGAQAIVTNPPYSLADDFVRKATSLVPDVYMLLKLQFLEGIGRSDIIDIGGGLKRVLVFSRRLPLMFLEGEEKRNPKAGSAMTFAWFHWQEGYSAEPTIGRIDHKSPGVDKFVDSAV